MPDDRTVLDHLLEGREALKREVERLTAAIAELDTVIGQIGGAGRRVGPPTTAATAIDEPVNPPAEVEPEPARPAAAPAARSSRAPAKRTSPRRSSAARASATAEPPKSIRVHVLDMLAAENRDFGLAEIIDRVHAAGIQAHDDAVRSITIKLMKDGQVERVGRGQYRLARGAQRARTDATEAETAPAPETVGTPETPQAAEPEATAPEPEPEPENYTPPLNLGQPWDTGA